MSYYISCAVLLGIPKISQTHAMNHGNYDEARSPGVMNGGAQWICDMFYMFCLQDLEGESIKTSKLSWATQFFRYRWHGWHMMAWIDIHGFFSGAWRHFYAKILCSKTTAVNQGWLNWLNHLIDFLSWNMVTTCWNWPVLVGVDDFFGAVPLASKMTRRDTSFAIPKLREEPT